MHQISSCWSNPTGVQFPHFSQSQAFIYSYWPIRGQKSDIFFNPIPTSCETWPWTWYSAFMLLFSFNHVDDNVIIPCQKLDAKLLTLKSSIKPVKLKNWIKRKMRIFLFRIGKQGWRTQNGKINFELAIDPICKKIVFLIFSNFPKVLAENAPPPSND